MREDKEQRKVIESLPTVNAILNSLSFVFLVIGRAFIRKGDIARHRASMIGALVASVLFLISYLVYHANVGATRFAAPPVLRAVYLTILTSHTLLAIVIVPLVLATLWRAVRVQFERHQRIARWTWPLWLYVSATGVIIYLILYVFFPQYAQRG
ncbi:MAG: DUF420 domain-containing protein [bacterium]|nr:DUF420 domain-containing protein [bacterium]MCS7310419.1 DUF420 domain-containing protein [Armatimonadota bacterium]MDW8104339.1 DUF420 domain-containing protein [Armatimonadota bacterium]